jgi:hypothetical protein
MVCLHTKQVNAREPEKWVRLYGSHHWKRFVSNELTNNRRLSVQTRLHKLLSKPLLQFE